MAPGSTDVGVGAVAPTAASARGDAPPPVDATRPLGDPASGLRRFAATPDAADDGQRASARPGDRDATAASVEVRPASPASARGAASPRSRVVLASGRAPDRSITEPPHRRFPAFAGLSPKVTTPVNFVSAPRAAAPG